MLLAHRPNPEGLGPVGAILVRDLPIGAVRSPHPSMKRALNTVPTHPSAMADMRAEVGAVGVENMERSVGVPIGDEILTEVAKGTHLFDPELDRPSDHEPAGWLPGERNLHVAPHTYSRDRLSRCPGGLGESPESFLLETLDPSGMFQPMAPGRVKKNSSAFPKR